MIKHYQSHGIRFVGGFQFWSNPLLANNEKAIPIVLSRPTFLDLMELSFKFGVDEIIKKNDELFQTNELSQYLYNKNNNWLQSIQLVNIQYEGKRGIVEPHSNGLHSLSR